MVQTANTTAPKRSLLPVEILRFRISERELHWAVAVPFVVCYATALVLVAVYNPDPTRPYRALFSWTHRLSGLCLFLLPLWSVARHRQDLATHLQNVDTAWRWRLEDIKWLFLMALSTFDKRVVLPDAQKFNAGEKLNFMFLTASYPLYIITGILIWLPGVAFASWIIHLSLAAMATPLILGHVFMATINPDTRVGLSGMITGYVNRRWARHHYRNWYDEQFGHLHQVPRPEPEPVMSQPVVAAAGTEWADCATQSVVSESNAAPKIKYNRDLQAREWPAMVRPSTVSQTIPETT